VYFDICLAGCPIQQDIEENFLPTASGEGLQFARENKSTSFIVDAGGRSGDLSVNVDGNLMSFIEIFLARQILTQLETIIFAPLSAQFVYSVACETIVYKSSITTCRKQTLYNGSAHCFEIICHRSLGWPRDKNVTGCEGLCKYM
jgi:hypothetical protein